jgi:hypothetical protein
LALPGALAAVIDSTIAGVRIGVQTYSFRNLPRPADRDPWDILVNAIAECGLGECELFAPQVEPAFAPGRGPASAEARKAREDLRKWRLGTTLDHFRTIRKRFDTAGISIFGYNYSFDDTFSDAEIERGFDWQQAPNPP